MHLKRQAWRNLWAAEGFERQDFRFNGAAEAALDPRLDEYLRGANLKFIQLDENLPFQARLALFRTLTFAHVASPRATVLWPRDHESRDRMAVVVCLAGGLTMSTDGALIRREGESTHAYIVPPGDEPVQIELSDVRNEVLYVSMPSSIAKAVRIDQASPGNGVLSEESIAPFLLFAARMCNIRVDARSDHSALSISAEEVARALTRVILGASANPPTLFHRCVDVLLHEYHDARLDVRTVAARFGVSVRTVQMTFQQQNTTFASELRKIRARAARVIRLSNKDLSRKDLADACGFGSVSALDRALRQTS